ncbi:TolC family protein [Legionella longbeachae]|uniref:Putative outer membrane efflux protein n=1 Tax=Legionella longbeachae serogroup 1 (strain NSW150) TaxID=661367 RepID=D3HK68_LEGLN|nr:TolC family protein [Legionella longbeachae]VEE03349.1 outer membrane efflux protein [Legionella oakridgensis]HBD7397628.1 TolC family protein [Legionella pneumophila]ARB93754.1 TolC family protein [Legionella longbeachae]ARM33106.1 TolC family protein [Legionella longbeachae]EEZ94056.1 outer membrane efflux protein [Legionella longbeachae D-4968]
MLKRISIFLLLIEIVTGCHRNVEQQVSTPLKKFPSSTKAYKPVNNLPYTAWWKQFHDLELNQLIETGLKNNMDIHIAIGNVQQAQGELQQIKLSWIPTLKLFAGYSTNPALGIPGAFYGVWPYYVLNIMQLYTQQKQATYNLQVYQAAVDGMRLALIGQITTAYFTLIAQMEQLRLLQQLDNDLKSLIALSQQDIKIGLVNEIDLAQLQSDEQIIAAQIKPILHNIVFSENALRFLINEIPGRVKNNNNFATLDFTRFKPGSLPATVLNNRPDMKMAEYALKASRIKISVAYSNFFPALQLDDFLGEVSSPHSTFAQSVDTYVNWTIAPSVLGNVAASKGAYHAKVAEFEKTVKRILKEVDTDYSANKRMNEQFVAYAQAEEDYRRKYKLQQGLLKTGLISYKDLLQSKIYLDNLALTTNQAKLELAMSLVALYQDLAGGYAYHLRPKKLQTDSST